MQQIQRGFSLVELLAAIAISVLVLAVTVPVMARVNRRAELRAACGQIRSTFHNTRMMAIARGRNVALRFSLAGGEWVYATYQDGDGDGVRNDDISRGVDRPVHPPRQVLQNTGAVRVGLPSSDIPDPAGSGTLGDRPVRFGTSMLCSFTPQGSSTAGTIYLTDDEDTVMMVRVFGPTARIRTSRFDTAAGAWERW